MHRSVWFVKSSGLLPVVFCELEIAEQTSSATLKLVGGRLICITDLRAEMAKEAKLGSLAKGGWRAVTTACANHKATARPRGPGPRKH